MKWWALSQLFSTSYYSSIQCLYFLPSFEIFWMSTLNSNRKYHKLKISICLFLRFVCRHMHALLFIFFFFFNLCLHKCHDFKCMEKKMLGKIPTCLLFTKLFEMLISDILKRIMYHKTWVLIACSFDIFLPLLTNTLNA